MILLCGIPSEPSLGLVIDVVRELGVPYLVFNQREFQSAALELQIDSNGVHGWMQYQDNAYRLEDFTAVYTRIVDYRFLPEIEAEPQDSPNRLHCAAVHDTLMRWHEIMPSRVLSRGSEVSVNYSKPFQAQLIHDQGFKVPDTLITNDPDLVRATPRARSQRMFLKRCGGDTLCVQKTRSRINGLCGVSTSGSGRA